MTLGLAKIIENMEIGHNVMHGQWTGCRSRDPLLDMGVGHERNFKHWRFTHNFQHHKYTNVLGMDDDVGYTVLRVTRDQPWEPFNIGNLLFNTILALGFEWGIGLQPIEFSESSGPAEVAQSPSSRCASFQQRQEGSWSRTMSRFRRLPRCRRRRPTNER